MTELRTERLLLRSWRDEDLEPWAALNADPEVREFFPGVLTREQSDEAAARYRKAVDARGWGWWAVEVRATGEFVGVAGMDTMHDLAVPGVEAGWRLARAAWSRGYATEAARAALGYAFTTLGLPEVFAITTATNVRSRAVMRRLGMAHEPAHDFDDPHAPEGPLRRNVVYRVGAGGAQG